LILSGESGEAACMPARIFQRPKNAMQSGRAHTDAWVLEFMQAEAKRADPLMGWTGSGDTQQQVVLTFSSAEEAQAYAERYEPRGLKGWSGTAPCNRPSARPYARPGVGWTFAFANLVRSGRKQPQRIAAGRSAPSSPPSIACLKQAFRTCFDFRPVSH
jgi:hypothetical protein